MLVEVHHCPLNDRQHLSVKLALRYIIEDDRVFRNLETNKSKYLYKHCKCTNRVELSDFLLVYQNTNRWRAICQPVRPRGMAIHSFTLSRQNLINQTSEILKVNYGEVIFWGSKFINGDYFVLNGYLSNQSKDQK